MTDSQIEALGRDIARFTLGTCTYIAAPVVVAVRSRMFLLVTSPLPSQVSLEVILVPYCEFFSPFTLSVATSLSAADGICLCSEASGDKAGACLKATLFGMSGPQRAFTGFG